MADKKHDLDFPVHAQRAGRGMWPELRSIVFVLIISRLLLTALGVAVRANDFSFTHGRVLAQPVTQHAWLNVWGLWDTGWYMRIAQQWYSTSEIQRFAFFPLFPALVRAIGVVVGHYFIVGLIFSNASLVVAIWLLYRFVATTNDGARGRWAVWFLLAFPSAFVLSGMFTEPLFLALSIGAFVAGQKKRWWLAGILAAFATLTRPLGAVVGLGLLIQFLRQRPVVPLKQFLWLLLVPVALGGWIFYNAAATGDPLTFIKVQREWRRHPTNPISALWTGITAPNTYDRASAIFWIGLMVIFFLLRHYLEPELQVYGWVSLLLPLFSGIYSLPRYGLVIFPLYVGLARSQIPPVGRWVILGAMGVAQILLFVYWPLLTSWVV